MNQIEYIKYCIVNLAFLIIRKLKSQSPIRIVSLPNDHMGDQIFINNMYERDLLLSLERFARKYYGTEINKLRCIDVGANIGNHSVFFSKIFRAVASYEPNIIALKLLEINKIINNSSNIEIIPKGIMEKKLAYKIVHPYENLGAGMLVEDNAFDNPERIEVETEKELLERFPLADIGLVKIDTEGSEISVLRAMRETLIRSKAIIVFEQQESEIVDGTSACIEYIKEMGYKYLYVANEKPGSEIKILKVLLRTIKGRKTVFEMTGRVEKRFHPMIVMTY
jgi:FkbM family methyltransferase